MGMSGFKGWVMGWGLLGCCTLALAQTAEVPQGYRVAQQVLVGDGSVLEVLEDLRITPNCTPTAGAMAWMPTALPTRRMSLRLRRWKPRRAWCPMVARSWRKSPSATRWPRWRRPRSTACRPRHFS